MELAYIHTSCPCLKIAMPKVVGPQSKVRAQAILDLTDEPDFTGDLRIEATGLTVKREVFFASEVHLRVCSTIGGE
jgi:hypothetical protein